MRSRGAVCCGHSWNALLHCSSCREQSVRLSGTLEIKLQMLIVNLFLQAKQQSLGDNSDKRTGGRRWACRCLIVISGLDERQGVNN